jgi:tetratricopeptide (TPR) repeat protein
VLSFRANHYFGEFDPFGYRVVNNALHAATTALLLVVSARARRRFAGMHFSPRCMFALHPVHTEAVSGVVGRAEALCAVLLLAAVLVLRARRARHRAALGLLAFVYRTTETRRGWFAAAVLLVLAATFAKESGFTAFGILVLLDWSHSVDALRLAAPRRRARVPAAFLRRAARTPFGARIAALVLVAMAYMAFRKHICVNYLLLNNRRLENPVAFSRGATKLLSNMYLHAFYGLLLLWPYNLSFDYSFDCIPLVHSLADPRNLITLAMYAAIVALAAAPFWLADERGRQTAAGAGALSLPVCGAVEHLSSRSARRSPSACSTCRRSASASSSAWRRAARSGATGGRAALPRAPCCSAPAWCCCARRTCRRRSSATSCGATRVCWSSSALPVCGRSSKDAEQLRPAAAPRAPQRGRAGRRSARRSTMLPTLCEQRYNIGVTQVSTGEIEDGLASLERGATCLWTMLQSLQVMRDVYQALAESGGVGAQRQLRRWADMMVKIGRYSEAAMSLEAIGTRLAELRELDESYAALTRAHELSPLAEEAHSLAVWLGNARELRGDLAGAVELLAGAAQSNDTTYGPAARERLRSVLPTMLPASVVRGVAALEASVRALERDAAALASDDVGAGASEAEQGAALQATVRLELLSACESEADAERATAQRLLAAARQLYIHGNAERALELASAAGAAGTAMAEEARRVQISVQQRAREATMTTNNK